MNARPRKVVIVGRDAALWLTATAIRQALAPAGVVVTAIELPTRLATSSVYSTLPPIEALHAKLGLDEAALLRATRGSFSLGWNIRPQDAEPFFVAHGAYGTAIEGTDFFPCWLKARHFGINAKLEDFSPTAMAARHGRVLVPDEATERFGRTDYGYHLPALAYAAALKSLAIRLGVVVHEVKGATAERDGETGAICAVIPDHGEPTAGDLFVDASGAEAALVGSGAGATEDWRSFFPFDQCLIAQGRPFSPLPAYSELQLSPTGSTALHATQDATYVVHAWRGAADGGLTSGATASALALENATAVPIAPGLRRAPWSGNCIAIGTSACSLDPIFDLDLHVVQLGLVHLISLYPTTLCADAERVEYNRITRSHYERLRDFQAALYLLTGFSSEAPPTLQDKLDAFRARGIVSAMEDETFTSDQWRALFIGLGVVPESWPPAIDKIAPDRMKEGFRRILGFVRDKVLEQPAHEAFLATVGGSETK